MNIKLTPTSLTTSWSKTTALRLVPEHAQSAIRVIYAHGYTASKVDCLPWAIRAAEAGIPAMVFDWPGHYLGGGSEVNDFQRFTHHAHEFFALALENLNQAASSHPEARRLVLGGHSLGALMALKALSLPEFRSYQRLGLGVGIGLNNQVETHLFDTDFYQKTLHIRRQLVSPALDSSRMFPWIRDEKTRLNLSGERIHLIVGEDDMVVGTGGLEAFKSHLELAGNQVSSFSPKRLAHHEPAMAAPHINAFLKQELALQ